MRLVDRPYARPMHCAALPYMGQTSRTRWIDTGSELHGNDNHIYLSEAAVTEAARLLGWVPGGELRQQQRATQQLADQLAEALAEVNTMREAWASVDVIESHGFLARKAEEKVA